MSDGRFTQYCRHPTSRQEETREVHLPRYKAVGSRARLPPLTSGSCVLRPKAPGLSVERFQRKQRAGRPEVVPAGLLAAAPLRVWADAGRVCAGIRSPRVSRRLLPLHTGNGLALSGP